MDRQGTFHSANQCLVWISLLAMTPARCLREDRRRQGDGRGWFDRHLYSIILVTINYTCRHN